MTKIAAVICVGSMLITVGCSPSPERADIYQAESLPFEVTHHLEIAGNALLERSSSLMLVCTETGELRLILFARLPAPREDVSIGQRDNAWLYVNGIEKRLGISAELVAMGKRDTIVSSPLPMADALTLVRWSQAAPLQRVSFVGFHEAGFYLRGAVSGNSLRTFVDRCQGSTH